MREGDSRRLRLNLRAPEGLKDGLALDAARHHLKLPLFDQLDGVVEPRLAEPEDVQREDRIGVRVGEEDRDDALSRPFEAFERGTGGRVELADVEVRDGLVLRL